MKWFSQINLPLLLVKLINLLGFRQFVLHKDVHEAVGPTLHNLTYRRQFFLQSLYGMKELVAHYMHGSFDKITDVKIFPCYILHPFT